MYNKSTTQASAFSEEAVWIMNLEECGRKRFVVLSKY
jgi:hypothetical protein